MSTDATSGTLGQGSDRTVAVVMPLRALDRFARDAIESVGRQTIKDVELIVVAHNMSEDACRELTGFANQHCRARVVRSNAVSLAEVRNAGLAAAKSAFVAVLDADDLALPRRLEVQRAYLEAQPDCSVVGSWVEEIDADERTIGLNQPRAEVYFCRRGGLFCQPGFVHSALMTRRANLERVGPYSPWFRAAHDQELLWRLSRIGQIHNVQTVLVKHRRHQDRKRVSNRLRRFQILASLRISQIDAASPPTLAPWYEDPLARRAASRGSDERARDVWFYAFLSAERTLRDASPSGALLAVFGRMTQRLVRRRLLPLKTAAVAVARLAKRRLSV